MGIIQNNQIREIFRRLSEECPGRLFSYLELADEVERRNRSIKSSKQQLVRLSMEFNVKRVKRKMHNRSEMFIAFYPDGVDVDAVDAED